LKIYGRTRPDRNERLALLCFEPCSLSAPEELGRDLTGLLNFAAPKGLRLICWNKLFNLEPDFESWLRFFELHYHE